MSLSFRCLKVVALICLALTWSLSTAAQTPVTPVKVQVSPAITLDPNDPLHQWFKEQDKLLDGILVRLSRIEKIVDDLHRLITQWPGPGNTLSAPASTPAPALTQAIPSTSSGSPGPSQNGGSLTDLIPQLLGGLVVLLLALGLWRRRHHKLAAPIQPMLAAHPNPDMPRQAVAKTAPTPAISARPLPGVQSAPVSLIHNDQALELAEIMLSMGLGHGAAQTLVEQIRREPRQALLHWLKLLEIYRKNGQKEEFERSAEELRQHFNVQPEDWLANPGLQRSLEDYPHIAAKLCDLWGEPSCLAYMKNLLDDNRGGARCGFPQSIAEELVLLNAVLRAELTGA